MEVRVRTVHPPPDKAAQWVEEEGEGAVGIISGLGTC